MQTRSRKNVPDMSRANRFVEWMYTHPNICIHVLGALIDTPRIAAVQSKYPFGQVLSAVGLPVFPAAVLKWGGPYEIQRRLARRNHAEHAVPDFIFTSMISPDDAEEAFRFYYAALTESGWISSGQVEQTSVDGLGAIDRMAFTKEDPPLKLEVAVCRNGPKMRRFQSGIDPSGPDPIYLSLDLWGQPVIAVDPDG